MAEKLWGGRFSLPTHKLAEEFNASINFDRKLYRFDIKGSIAHVEMLAKQRIIAEAEAKQIKDGLEKIEVEIEKGDFEFRDEDEDIHMAIEKKLHEMIGPVAGKLHTARSRNDQVATDFRMYLREKVDEISECLRELMQVIVDKSREEIEVVMPGYTHLQTAQPVLFSHYAMAYFQMFKRDFLRFKDFRDRMNECPLGAGALAGTTFDIDRDYTAEKLGFDKPTSNSLDSVSDRDFALEFLSAASICGMHLSRISEEMIIFSSAEFAFLDLSDDFCTGSSIMPQKKNPDMPELIRGKTGRLYGNMISLFTTLKGLPLAYNKDMQEDKEPVFDSMETLISSLKIFTEMFAKMKLNEKKMKKAAGGGFSTATDLADYLVRKGLPFREAHNIVGRTVAYALSKNKGLEDLKLEEFRQFSSDIEEDIFEYVVVAKSVDSRKAKGGTAKSSVLQQIKEAEEFLT
ncbi:MAG: argininosuccinate lyase [Flexistipes sinusarabici]|uniref:Argininosuccinate lyase n=1 Tax=Flexistipes sinusarabici TaxID=2352 RepID=A0A5D0MHE2_FLESI|nr:argininosuccinate lyase [Flexistipes sinusarabici]TYB33134.1 MAG: argininosuccinate lyase [Flexistipes sinusarabici]